MMGGGGGGGQGLSANKKVYQRNTEIMFISWEKNMQIYDIY